MNSISGEELSGWTLEVLRCVELINKKEFDLFDVYQFKERLHILYPENNNIEAKIRQQLQILRDKHYIIFLGDGRYRKLFD